MKILGICLLIGCFVQSFTSLDHYDFWNLWQKSNAFDDLNRFGTSKFVYKLSGKIYNNPAMTELMGSDLRVFVGILCKAILEKVILTCTLLVTRKWIFCRSKSKLLWDGLIFLAFLCHCTHAYYYRWHPRNNDDGDFWQCKIDDTCLYPYITSSPNQWASISFYLQAVSWIMFYGPSWVVFHGYVQTTVYLSRAFHNLAKKIKTSQDPDILRPIGIELIKELKFWRKNYLFYIDGALFSYIGLLIVVGLQPAELLFPSVFIISLLFFGSFVSFFKCSINNQLQMHYLESLDRTLAKKFRDLHVIFKESHKGLSSTVLGGPVSFTKVVVFFRNIIGIIVLLLSIHPDFNAQDQSKSCST